MSDKEFGEEADTMPPKTMSQEAIKKMVEELLAEKLKEAGQWKGKEKVGGDESDDKQENEEEGAIVKEVQKMPADQKIFVDALKLVNRDNVESLPTYGGSLNGEEVLDWIEALNNHFEYKEVPKDKKIKSKEGENKIRKVEEARTLGVEVALEEEEHHQRMVNQTPKKAMERQVVEEEILGVALEEEGLMDEVDLAIKERVLVYSLGSAINATKRGIP
ncbi:uncharacterized protein LOC131875220 [Cryptomeria japonica]|uniref:uncharacterized protein LOC131875220 n=1 Tax=Cryptomeria japonica TaxID=3369 RepID=UPI0027DA5ED1|nr:uncharacterized protein LOC131875220 [Cryptomeria japonica]